MCYRQWLGNEEGKKMGFLLEVVLHYKASKMINKCEIFKKQVVHFSKFLKAQYIRVSLFSINNWEGIKRFLAKIKIQLIYRKSDKKNLDLWTELPVSVLLSTIFDVIFHLTGFWSWREWTESSNRWKWYV